MDGSRIVSTTIAGLSPQEAGGEIERLRAENAALREICGDLIQGAKRDRAIITPRLGPLHVIETRMTKGQVLRAMALIREAPSNG